MSFVLSFNSSCENLSAQTQNEKRMLRRWKPPVAAGLATAHHRSHASLSSSVGSGAKQRPR